MYTYNVLDKDFMNSSLYKEFINNNSSRGSLRIRAYAASEAVPISNVKVTVSTIYENNKIIFFEGYTDSSGLIAKISLPAPSLNMNNLDIPNKRVYEVNAMYQNINNTYEVNIYENICVLQNINIIPELMVGEISGK